MDRAIAKDLAMGIHRNLMGRRDLEHGKTKITMGRFLTNNEDGFTYMLNSRMATYVVGIPMAKRAILLKMSRDAQKKIIGWIYRDLIKTDDARFAAGVNIELIEIGGKISFKKEGFETNFTGGAITG
jgi:hypothetical protein